MKIAVIANTAWNIYNFRLNLISALMENNTFLGVILTDVKTLKYEIETYFSFITQH